MIDAFDTPFGGVLQSLEDEGIADNTVAIFTSDDGMSGQCGYFDLLRGEKGRCYEGGTRVPTIVYWPGKTQAVRTDALIDVIDWYPTLMEITGAESPKHTLDGVSIVPLLTGEAATVRGAVFVRMPRYNGSPGRPQVWQTPFSSVVEGKYKLIYRYETQQRELSDLENDMGEAESLVASHPEIAERLHRRLKKWLDDNQAPLPQKR